MPAPRRLPLFDADSFAGNVRDVVCRIAFNGLESRV
jgi:hypothetical protein